MLSLRYELLSNYPLYGVSFFLINGFGGTDIHENAVSCSSESLETAAKYSGSCSVRLAMRS